MANKPPAKVQTQAPRNARSGAAHIPPKDAARSTPDALTVPRPAKLLMVNPGDHGSNGKRRKIGRYSVGGRGTSERARQIPRDDLQPWERQPDETPEAYRYFCYYRDADPAERSQAHVQRKFGLSRTVVCRHSSNHRWIERAATWDFHIERCRLAKTETMQTEMASRHAEIAVVMLTRVKQRLARINFNKLDPKAIAAWLEVGVKVERLSRGLSPTEASDRMSKVSVNINSMTDQDILAQIAIEGNKRGSLTPETLIQGKLPELEAASDAAPAE